MTLLAVILMGAGFLLLASALDNSSPIDTFNKLRSGQAIDWSGSGKTPTSQISATPPSPAKQVHTIGKPIPS